MRARRTAASPLRTARRPVPARVRWRGRSSSSTCAVNCNAQFKPHRDSGAGAGQHGQLGFVEFVAAIVRIARAKYEEVLAIGRSIHHEGKRKQLEALQLPEWFRAMLMIEGAQFDDLQRHLFYQALPEEMKMLRAAAVRSTLETN